MSGVPNWVWGLLCWVVAILLILALVHGGTKDADD